MNTRFAARLAIAGLLLLASVTPASAQEVIEYYGLDALGSVRIILDQNGQPIERMDYGPFGENLKASIKMSFEQYALLARDAESGQDHAQARNYSPSIGRFNRPDPLYAGLFSPQRWNRYVYAGNRPTTLIDPAGLAEGFPEGYCVEFPDACRPEPSEPGEIPTFPRPGPEPGKGGCTPSPTFGGDCGGPEEPPGGGGGPGTQTPPVNNCEAFVKTLTRQTKVVKQKVQKGPMLRRQAEGAVMMYVANYMDPWQRKPTVGFHSYLLDEQGSDVYRHIWGHAGAILARGVGGDMMHRYQLGIDQDQMRKGYPSGASEVLGSTAGARIGELMIVAIRDDVSWTTFEEKVTQIICSPK